MDFMCRIKAINTIFVNYAKVDMMKNVIVSIANRFILKQLMTEKIGFNARSVRNGFIRSVQL